MKRTNRRWLASLCAAGTAVGVNAAVIDVTGDITTDTKWSNTNTYRLMTTIYVTHGATLEVEPGTLIRGRQPGVGERPGTLVISRGAKGRFLGTAAQPIVMTSWDDNHFVGPNPTAGTAPWNTLNNGITERWGGLVILGRTYLADQPSDPNPSKTKQIEGIAADGDKSRYGGGNDDDTSGVFRHISIRYGGHVIGTHNEINGLTMGGVGRGTTIEHIEVFQTKDDAFEWFGCTVNTKYLLAWNYGDDGFDWDEGFRGKGQFLVDVQGVLTQPVTGGADRSDKGWEMDGATSADWVQPSSIGTFYNVTSIGLGKGTATNNAALSFRDGSGGRFYNSMFLDFGGPCALIEGNSDPAVHTSAKMAGYVYAHWKPAGNNPTNNLGAALSNYIGYDHETVGSRMLEVRNSVFWNMGYPNAFGSVGGGGNAVGNLWGADGADGNRPFLGHGPYLIGGVSYGAATGLDLFAAGFNNVYAGDTTATRPILVLERRLTPVVVGGINFYPIEAVNLNLAPGSTFLTGGRTPPADGFYTPVAFRGAFDHTRNWAGWTTAARKGLVEIEPTTLRTDYDDPFVTDHMTFTVKWHAELSALTYRVQWKASMLDPTWTTLQTRSGVTGSQVFTDTRELAGSGFYKVTKE